MSLSVCVCVCVRVCVCVFGGYLNYVERFWSDFGEELSSCSGIMTVQSGDSMINPTFRNMKV
jgi:hypothetical protein